jgi:hypothetical protein
MGCVEVTINIEIRTAEERGTVQRLIDRLNRAEDGTPEKARLVLLRAAAKAWDDKQAEAGEVSATKRQSKR